jgi:indolepyruvate ferredoxin oxidoreductase alpha subunit
MKELLTGNEAVARGTYEAGARVCSAYPGTPSTEILENMPQFKDSVYSEWAPNEKVALEVAYGASISGVRSMCAMKHVGLNVAADPLFTASYNGVGGGFVVITADDPAMHSSQNEQDNRHYAKAAKIPMVEPSDSQECKDFMRIAFEISEQFNTPVLFRMTTRVCHSKSAVELGPRQEIAVPEYKPNLDKFMSSPAAARIHHKEVEERTLRLEEFSNHCEINRMEMNGPEIGVVTASICYQYSKEAFPEGTSFLKLGLTNPLPIELIREFASKVKKLYVVEELDPYMEEAIKAAGIECIGKELTGLLYELNPQLLEERIFGKKPAPVELGVNPVSRPPALCPGCPHRGFFYTMSRQKKTVVTGDIGCYTLGYMPPIKVQEALVCMGGGFTLAMGMAKGFEASGVKDKKVFGIMGDSTFFHSGMTGAAEIIYNKGAVVPVILDNSITGMTGHQDNPGTGLTLQGDVADVIKIEDVLAAIGFKKIIIVDPQDLKAMDQAVKDANESTVPAAIITRRPCILIKNIKHDIGKCQVDPEKCKSCKMCLKVGCPAIGMKDNKAFIDQTQCVGCTVCAQVCPFDAIERLGD